MFFLQKSPGQEWVKMQKLLNFYNKVFRERQKRPHSQSFYYSILLKLFIFIVFNLLLCLISKLSFIIGMCP